MLSQTQRWRHLKSRSGNRHRRRHEEQYLQKHISQLHEENIQDCVENEQIILSSITLPKKSNQTEILTESKPVTNERSRKVKFNPVIRVCLVPCRSDFRRDFYILFWGRDDYQKFKEDALQELREHWIKHHKTVKEAIFDLYQPEPIKESRGTEKLLTHVDSVAHLSVMANLNKQLTEEGKEKVNRNEAIVEETMLIEKVSISPTTDNDNDMNSNNMDGTSMIHGSVLEHEGVGSMQSPLHSAGNIRTGQAGSTPLSFTSLPDYIKTRPMHGISAVEDGESVGLLELLSGTLDTEEDRIDTTASADDTPQVSPITQSKYNNNLNDNVDISSLRVRINTTSASEEEEGVSPYNNSSSIASPVPQTPPPSSREYISTGILDTENYHKASYEVSEELVTTDSSQSTPPLHQQQSQQESRGDNGNTTSSSSSSIGTSSVRMRLLEDSPSSSVSSFEPPILIC